MRTHAATIVAVITVSGFGLLAADVFQEYGIERDNWSTSFLSALTSRSFYVPSVPAKLKGLPAEQRAAVIKALGAAAKLYVSSPEFLAKYKEEYEAKLPDDLKPPRTAKEIGDELKKEMQSQIAEMEKTAKTMSGDMQKAILEAATALKAQMGEMDQLAAMQAAEEKRRYDEAKSRPPDPSLPSPDSNVGLKRGLNAFLEVTNGVDFAAQVKTASGRKTFANADYEAKPAAWKACFRAGKEACEAARDFASTWLKELK